MLCHTAIFRYWLPYRRHFHGSACQDNRGARDNHLQLRLMDFCRCKHFDSYELEVGRRSFTHHPPSLHVYLFHFFGFSEGAKTAGDFFVMVLKGLSASKPRELVVQPISETTQSFPRCRRERAASARGQNSPAKLSIRSFNIKLGEANLHSLLTSALIHPEALPQPLEHLHQELFSIWLITCLKKKKKSCSNHCSHQLCQQVAAAAAAGGNSTQKPERASSENHVCFTYSIDATSSHPQLFFCLLLSS